MPDEQNLSKIMADFMTNKDNGYHLDINATRKLNADIPNPTGIERKVYTNGSTYVCAQTDNKTFIAFNKAHEKEVPTKQWILEGPRGGRVNITPENNTPPALKERMKLIFQDNNFISMVSAKGAEKLKS